MFINKNFNKINLYHELKKLTDVEVEDPELIDPQSLYDTYFDGIAFLKLSMSTSSSSWLFKLILNVVVYCCPILQIDAFTGCLVCGGFADACLFAPW